MHYVFLAKQLCQLTWDKLPIPYSTNTEVTWHVWHSNIVHPQEKMPGHILSVRHSHSTSLWPTVCNNKIQYKTFNPLNPELNPICYLLALLGAHHFLHVSRIRVKLLTLRRLMSYIYGAPFLMFLDHTQRRSTVGRTPLDE